MLIFEIESRRKQNVLQKFKVKVVENILNSIDEYVNRTRGRRYPAPAIDTTVVAGSEYCNTKSIRFTFCLAYNPAQRLDSLTKGRSNSMCDSMLAVKSDTADGVAIFAKNSDRPPNEAQVVEYFSSANYPKNETVKCTYIEIPQVVHTNAILLSKPYWIWGAEMGVNDHHVVIGNEAVFPKVPVEKNTRLIGMDLVRLGLERGNTARHALEVIISLLEEFGQGGSCIVGSDYYYSSFLIADPDDAWVLETAGKLYATKHVTRSDSISNYLTIGTDYVPEMSSPNLAEYAVQKGWAKSVQGFNFGDAYNDFLITTLVGGRRRRRVHAGSAQRLQGCH